MEQPLIKDRDREAIIESIEPLTSALLLGSFRASLLLTGSIVPLPIVAAIITAILYITRPNWITIAAIPTVLIIPIGILITLLLWLLVSPFFRSFTTFDNANAQSGSYLRQHMLALKSGLELLVAKKNIQRQDETTQDYDLALDTVRSCLEEINRSVRRRNQIWVMGNGYIGMWNFVHRAEEAMFAIAPREDVIREALHDESAIDGSAIANRDYVLSNIKTAVKMLSPSAALYLKSLPVQDRATTSSNNDSPTTINISATQLGPVKELEARNALRDARQTLNEFRTRLWVALVRIRNQLIGTALITALLTYVLLCMIIITFATAESIITTAIISYLVGAIVGLFGRLYAEAQSDSTIDDYGLAVARVVITPLLSGLAAIAGVLVISLLSINVLNNPQGILFAAIFGLTPNFIINILQQKANIVKAKLENSSASNRENS
jgi:hypothetical protein